MRNFTDFVNKYKILSFVTKTISGFPAYRYFDSDKDDQPFTPSQKKKTTYQFLTTQPYTEHTTKMRIVTFTDRRSIVRAVQCNFGRCMTPGASRRRKMRFYQKCAVGAAAPPLRSSSLRSVFNFVHIMYYFGHVALIYQMD